MRAREVGNLKGEVAYVLDIANQMIAKYRILKDIVPETWEEIEDRTGPKKAT